MEFILLHSSSRRPVFVGALVLHSALTQLVDVDRPAVRVLSAVALFVFFIGSGRSVVVFVLAAP